ncbi:MAG TPA: metalloregulator ArsR/SmtB family transcription factor [Syntrophales bacterium]|nr:metalloregulator ArsR/SmtB family transcription factor [Syntrophales bacterium]
MKYDPIEILKALSNPSRVGILKEIYKTDVRGCCDENPSWDKCSCVGDIVEKFHLAPSTISHHMKELSRAGLIRVSKEGQFVRVVPNPEALRNVVEFMEEIMKSGQKA